MLIKEIKDQHPFGETYRFMNWETQQSKCFNPPRLMCRFNTILIKILEKFFVNIDKGILNFIRKIKRNKRKTIKK